MLVRLPVHTDGVIVQLNKSNQSNFRPSLELKCGLKFNISTIQNGQHLNKWKKILPIYVLYSVAK